jgi:anti-sigma B factor antagonist
MQMKENIFGKIIILEITCKMLGDSETQQLFDKIKTLCVSGNKKIVLDLSKVKLINSIGVGVIMACWTTVSKAGGNLILAEITEKVYSILKILDLDQFFENYPNLEKALKSF